MTQLLTHVVTLALGAVFGAWYTVYLKRPKLEQTGSGGGGGPGPGFRTSYVQITNRPGLMGLRLDESVVFGRPLHGPIERGLTFDRNPATNCTAYLQHKESDEHIGSLFWRSSSDPASGFQQVVTIPSGESFQLMLFARLNDEPGTYFAFAPEGDTSAPRVPADQAKLDVTHTFVVRVNSHGRPVMSFDVEVRKALDGRLSIQTGTSGGSF